jgi:nucleotide-binding universal stress UspA family protein
LEKGTREELARRLDEFCKSELKDRAECLKRIKDIVVEEGNTVEVILKVTAEKDCDVIIMGNHGAGGWTHTFLGNVAKKVLRRSKKPVYIIPLPE